MRRISRASHPSKSKIADLLEDEQTEKLSEQLFHTLRDYYLQLDDGVIVYPCHGAGSTCGPDIGERPMSTIGASSTARPAQANS